MLNATKESAISCMALDASCNFACLRLSRENDDAEGPLYLQGSEHGARVYRPTDLREHERDVEKATMSPIPHST
jgi:hypothetical protein